MLVPIPALRSGHAQGRTGHDAARPSIFVLGTPSNFATTLIEAFLTWPNYVMVATTGSG